MHYRPPIDAVAPSIIMDLFSNLTSGTANDSKQHANNLSYRTLTAAGGNMNMLGSSPIQLNPEQQQYLLSTSLNSLSTSNRGQVPCPSFSFPLSASAQMPIMRPTVSNEEAMLTSALERLKQQNFALKLALSSSLTTEERAQARLHQAYGGGSPIQMNSLNCPLNSDFKKQKQCPQQPKPKKTLEKKDELPPGRIYVPSERKSLASSQDCKTPEQVAKVLKVLGTTLRSKADEYVDAASYRDPGMARCARGGVCELFPDKLYRMLQELEANGEDDIASFLPHGRAFRVHNMDRFVAQVLPRYFSEQSKWSSFSRQLQLYGFLRVSWGNDADAYYHELFLKGRPNLCHYMRRVGIPKGFDRRRFKLPQGDDPDFSKYPLPTSNYEVETKW